MLKHLNVTFEWSRNVLKQVMTFKNVGNLLLKVMHVTWAGIACLFLTTTNPKVLFLVTVMKALSHQK